MNRTDAKLLRDIAKFLENLARFTIDYSIIRKLVLWSENLKRMAEDLDPDNDYPEDEE